MTDLTDSVTIITGASSGIGRASAEQYLANNSHVVLVDINQEALDETTTQLAKADNTLTLCLDISKEEDMQSMADKTMQRFGRIDTLIASAGILRVGGLKTVSNMSFDEWSRVININLTGTFLSNRAVLPHMMKQKAGDIINISSVSGKQAHAFDSAYASSKFGMIGLSEAMAEEVAPFGIRVQSVLPDAVDTPIWDQNPGAMRADDNLSPQRVAEFIFYLTTMPRDMFLLNPVIAPMKTRKRRKKKKKAE